MILGMSTAIFTLLHVVISLVGIVAGAFALRGMIENKKLDFWAPLFLAATVLTSVTGFLFHFTSFGPPEIVGAISLVVLAIALVALYPSHLAGLWRPVYVVTAVLAFYLNFFVLVVQAFQKVGFLHALAPTGSEPPFVVAQAVVLVAFLVLGTIAVRRFHRGAPA
jgi:hypothetical protein